MKFTVEKENGFLKTMKSGKYRGERGKLATMILTYVSTVEYYWLDGYEGELIEDGYFDA